MLELILIRHGETDSNIRHAYCGWTDAALNDNGKAQAGRAADRLKDVKADFVYSSPLKRTLETASIITGGSAADIITDDRLKEQNFGEWEDLTYEEITCKDPEECLKWRADWANYCMKSGESPAQMYKRVTEFIDGLIARHHSSSVFVVTHLGCIRMMLAYLLGMPFEGLWRFRVDNCGISRVMINDEKFAYLQGLNC